MWGLSPCVGDAWWITSPCNQEISLASKGGNGIFRLWLFGLWVTRGRGKSEGSVVKSEMTRHLVQPLYSPCLEWWHNSRHKEWMLWHVCVYNGIYLTSVLAAEWSAPWFTMFELSTLALVPQILCCFRCNFYCPCQNKGINKGRWWGKILLTAVPQTFSWFFFRLRRRFVFSFRIFVHVFKKIFAKMLVKGYTISNRLWIPLEVQILH